MNHDRSLELSVRPKRALFGSGSPPSSSEGFRSLESVRSDEAERDLERDDLDASESDADPVEDPEDLDLDLDLWAGERERESDAALSGDEETSLFRLSLRDFVLPLSFFPTAP
jgi:hypothetical protein